LNFISLCRLYKISTYSIPKAIASPHPRSDRTTFTSLKQQSHPHTPKSELLAAALRYRTLTTPNSDSYGALRYRTPTSPKAIPTERFAIASPHPKAIASPHPKRDRSPTSPKQRLLSHIPKTAMTIIQTPSCIKKVKERCYAGKTSKIKT
jgi:hypothetical protein